jgi:sulfur carrier protein ThiS
MLGVMAEVHFTPHLQRFLDCPPTEVSGATVAEAFDSLFAERPKLRSYLLDDQDQLRKHVAVFVDGEMIRDRRTLSDPISPTGRIDVLQALSGG